MHLRTTTLNNLSRHMISVIGGSCHTNRAPTSVLAVRDIVLANRLRGWQSDGPAHAHHTSLLVTILEIHASAVVQLVKILAVGYLFIRRRTGSRPLASLVLGISCWVVEFQSKFHMFLPIRQPFSCASLHLQRAHSVHKFLQVRGRYVVLRLKVILVRIKSASLRLHTEHRDACRIAGWAYACLGKSTPAWLGEQPFTHALMLIAAEVHRRAKGGTAVSGLAPPALWAGRRTQSPSA